MTASVNLEQRLETWVIDPQLESPLFNKLPPEIRRDIFTFALTPIVTAYPCSYWDPDDGRPRDFHVRYDHNGHPDDDIIEELASIEGDPQLDLFWEDSFRAFSLCEKWIYLDHFQVARFPEDTGGNPPLFTTKLLATCRRVFAEAHLLVFENERWHHQDIEPTSQSASQDSPPDGEKYRFGNPTPYRQWSMERVEWERRFTRIHFTGCLDHLFPYYLWNSNYLSPWCQFTKKRFQLNTVEHLRVSPRRGSTWMTGRSRIHSYYLGFYDFWTPLLKEVPLDTIYHGGLPFLAAIINAAQSHRRRKQEEDSGLSEGAPDHAPAVSGRPSWVPTPNDSQCDYPERCWARQFVNMPHIQTLTIDFHCPENVREDVDASIEFVVDTWRFPLNPKHAGYHYLSAEGNPVRKMSWRGRQSQWLEFCLECTEGTAPGPRTPPSWCKSHASGREKILKGIGPRMYTWTVTWTRRKHDGPETYPYNGCIEVLDGDYQEKGDSDIDPDEEVGQEELGAESGVELAEESESESEPPSKRAKLGSNDERGETEHSNPNPST